jgi:hypothetical protein
VTERKHLKRRARERAVATGERYTTALLHLRTLEEEPMSEIDTSTLHCSFCGHSAQEVRKLVAGPNDVYICDACIGLAADIIANEDAAQAENPGGTR